MSEPEIQKAWVMTLEEIVVPGDTLEQAITNCISHLEKYASEGCYPQVVSAKRVNLKMNADDSTDKQ